MTGAFAPDVCECIGNQAVVVVFSTSASFDNALRQQVPNRDVFWFIGKRASGWSLRHPEENT
jgi:hypothetical protein